MNADESPKRIVDLTKKFIGKQAGSGGFVMYRLSPILFLLVIILVMAGACALFTKLVSTYRENVVTESAEHLAEINAQVRLNIEKQVNDDWRLLYSLADTISRFKFDDDRQLPELMESKRKTWNAADIIVYTENGGNVSTDGVVRNNGIASALISNAVRQGEYLSIVDSDVSYIIPVNTNKEYMSSRIVAISMVRSMKNLLDDMGFYSFGGSAYTYLADQNGLIISRLSNENARYAFNASALFENVDIISVSGESQTVKDVMAVSKPTTFVLSSPSGRQYAVSSPIRTRLNTMRLFFFVPEIVANRTVNTFTQAIIHTSVLVIAVFVLCAFAAFLYIYRMRKRQFNVSLLAREHLFDLLIKNSRTAFGLFTLDQPPEYVSSNVEAIIGEPYFLISRSDDGYSIKGASGIETGAIRQLNETLKTWDGKDAYRSAFLKNDRSQEPQWYEIQIFPIGVKDAKDDVHTLEYVGIAQDVTQLQMRETAVRDALSMAEQASLAKTRFLSNMSHDIRTPMNAIVNMSDFAMEDMDDREKLTEHLKTIRESADHLLMLINDILDMSRIESGKAVVEMRPFSLHDEMERLKSIVLPLCAAKRQELLTDFDGLKCDGVLGDQTKVAQIVMNLLSNAVKYTPDGGTVKFAVKNMPSLSDSVLTVRFTVGDDGIGIPKDQIGRIFEPFARVDEKRVSRTEGSGLGLSICHSYVIAMGGTIECQSEVGKGSVFTVDLFFEKADVSRRKDTGAPVLNSKPFAGMRCLLVEDNGANQKIAKAMLERQGFTVDMASDGHKGLSMFLESDCSFYAVVYMDIQMPVMDGYQATAGIRQSARGDARSVPIIAMTANVFAEDVEKARFAGMDGHVGKPITTAALVDETRKAINNRRMSK